MGPLKSFLKRRLQGTRLLRWYYTLYPQRPLYVESLWAYVRLSRWVVYLRLRLRMFFFLTIRKFRISLFNVQDTEQPAGASHLPKVLRHNLWTDFSTQFCRRRSEHLIYLLRAIPSVGPQSRVLSIGPKNEGEILLFRAHGFRHVTGADLFSYSPFIKTMDMHHMTFPDNSFDIVNSGWVVRYSYDIAQCAREMVRVAAPGSLMSIAFSGHAEEKDPSPGIGAPLHGGLDELLRHFGPHVGHVYWRLEDHNTDESKVPEHTHSVIFRVKK